MNDQSPAPSKDVCKHGVPTDNPCFDCDDHPIPITPPAPSKEMEERLQRMRNAMETLDQQARPLASQWRIHAWTLMTLAESIAAERNDKFPALVLMVETLKRELADQKQQSEAVGAMNVELEAKLGAAEKIQATMEEAIAIKNKLYSDLRSQLLALSLAYQRQKDALKMVEEEVTPGVYSRNFWATIRSALAETPDVSLLGRVVECLKLCAEAKIFCEDSMDIDDHATRAVHELLSTLQPDHQK